MSCEKCGEENPYNIPYCPYCGAKTEYLKKNTKGIIIIRPDKALVVGVVSTILGIGFAAACFIPYHVALITGICFAQSMVFFILGTTLLKSQFRYMKKKPTLSNICKYCDAEILPDWNFCYRCGSKIAK